MSGKLRTSVRTIVTMPPMTPPSSISEEDLVKISAFTRKSYQSYQHGDIARKTTRLRGIFILLLIRPKSELRNEIAIVTSKILVADVVEARECIVVVEIDGVPSIFWDRVCDIPCRSISSCHHEMIKWIAPEHRRCFVYLEGVAVWSPSVSIVPSIARRNADVSITPPKDRSTVLWPEACCIRRRKPSAKIIHAREHSVLLRIII